MSIAIASTVSEPRLWVTLHLHDVADSRVAVLAFLSDETFKKFCRELRAAKLRYLSQDRQEPGGYDEGAALLIEWADEVLAVMPNGGSQNLELASSGIREHRDELAAHLETAPEDRASIRVE